MAVIERRSIPINENVQIKPLIIAVVFTTFATVAVALRLFAKHLVQSRFGKDDYMIMICLVKKSEIRIRLAGRLT